MDGASSASGNTLYFHGTMPFYHRNVTLIRKSPDGRTGMRYCMGCRVMSTDGTALATADGVLKISDSTDCVLAVAIRSNFKDYKTDPAQSGINETALVEDDLTQAGQFSFETLLERHLADYSALYERSILDFPECSDDVHPALSRFRHAYRGEVEDISPGLIALLYHYGRYLGIASSRSGTQPTNLQGIWNDLFTPPWASNYTMNINTEMNYWLAENANLSECHTPLFDMIESMVTNGRKTAKQLYQIENGGWVAHHNTDLWRQCGPIDLVPTGLWPMGAAWLSLHFWNHYEFTRNLDDLKKHYPVMRDAARFFLDFLIPDEKHGGVLVTSPSYSPEQGPLCASPTMDTGILMALFKAVIS